MSASVYYSKQRKGTYLKGDVHEYIKKKLQKEDIHEIIVSPYDNMFSYIQALYDLGISGTRELLDAIIESDGLEIWLEY